MWKASPNALAESECGKQSAIQQNRVARKRHIRKACTSRASIIDHCRGLDMSASLKLNACEIADTDSPTPASLAPCEAIPFCTGVAPQPRKQNTAPKLALGSRPTFRKDRAACQSDEWCHKQTWPN